MRDDALLRRERDAIAITATAHAAFFAAAVTAAANATIAASTHAATVAAAATTRAAASSAQPQPRLLPAVRGERGRLPLLLRRGRCMLPSWHDLRRPGVR